MSNVDPLCSKVLGINQSYLIRRLISLRNLVSRISCQSFRGGHKCGSEYLINHTIRFGKFAGSAFNDTLFTSVFINRNLHVL